MQFVDIEKIGKRSGHVCESVFLSHPDVLQFVLHQALRHGQIHPFILASVCAALTIDVHPKEHHLL